MQDVDGVAHVQALPQPARDRRARAQDKPLRIVPRSQDLDGIAGHLGKRRNLGQQPAVRPAETKLAVGVSIDLVALFMDRAVMPATEQGEIREGGRASLGPVADVMALADPDSAAREAAAPVAVVERSS
jgi:hypothetical protein